MFRPHVSVLLASSIFSVFLAGCGKDIVVEACDGHTAEVADGGVVAQADADVRPDATATPDAGFTDTGPGIDVGNDPCVGLGYCLRDVTASAEVIDVLEPVTLTPVVENPGQETLTYSVDPAQITSERLPGRPALVLNEIQVEYSVGTDGEATFRVLDVPPWFMETTFILPLSVRSAGGPMLTAEARVVVRGNTVFSSGNEGIVYAVNSAGRPATQNGMFPEGELLEQSVRVPRALLVSRDGTLLVMDQMTTDPARIRRFSMAGPEIMADEFEFEDGTQERRIREDAESILTMAEMPDGRVVVAATWFAGPSTAPKAALLIWGQDGTFDRQVLSPTSDEKWRSVSVSANGELVVADRTARKVSRIDPTNFQIAGTLVDALPRDVWSVLGLPNGDHYVGGEGYIFHVMAGGGRAAVMGDANNMLPSGGTHHYRSLGAGPGDRVQFTRNTQTSSGNIGQAEGRRFLGWLRPMNVGGRVTLPNGIAYLR